jgi:VanZ family protein
LLWLYLVGVFVFAVLPASLPATSPKQIYDRYREGQISLIPFVDAQSWKDVAKNAIVGVLLFVPAGLWGALAFRKPGEPLRSLKYAVTIGAAFAGLVTVTRGLCSVDTTDSSWLLTGLLGSAMGAAAMHVSVNAAARRGANWKISLGWWLVVLAFSLLLVGNYLHPWIFDAPPEQVASGWRQFINMPFAGFHSGDDWRLIEEVVRKLAWFGAFGLLLGQAVCRSTEFPVDRIIGGVFAMLWVVAVALAIELGQLHQTVHSPEITDVVIYVVGAALGLWIRFTWLKEGAGDDIPKPPGHELESPSVTPVSWTVLSCTAAALGLMIVLLTGLAVSFLRR